MEYSLSEVATHNNKDSCWIIIDNCVYDVTNFLDSHPGGAAVILASAGQDATEEYEPVHPPGTLEAQLPKEALLGKVKESERSKPAPLKAPEPVKDGADKDHISLCLNLHDFERVARSKLDKRAWIYYSSSSEDSVSFGLNRRDWSEIIFRPRVMRNVHTVNMKRRMLGHNSSLPIFIAPAALARLGHPDGELCLARGAMHHNIPYAVSTASSVSFEELAKCMQLPSTDRGTLWFQLYVKKKRSETEELIRRAQGLGFKALLITVDTAAVAPREDDDRYKAEVALAAGNQLPQDVFAQTPTEGEEAPAYRAPYSSKLCWEDLTWIREAWGDSGPIAVKGVATVEDAVLACRHKVDCIYLSNHGGRQLDGSPSTVRTLIEIRQHAPWIFDKCEVLIDGGVRRGSDVVKALCLGAKAVGLGRPFMFALSAFGTAGVVKAILMLNQEIQTTLRLLGVTSLDELGPHCINAKALSSLASDDVDSRQLKLLYPKL